MINLRGIKRIELQDIAEGWDKQAYIKFQTYSQQDIDKIKELSKLILESEDSSQYDAPMLDIYKGLFVEGKGYSLVKNKETGEFDNTLVDLQPEHLDQLFILPGVRERILTALMRDERLKE